jgi:hypothetical protein
VPGVLIAVGIPFVTIVSGVCMVVPAGIAVVDGTVVGTGVAPPPGCVVQPAQRMTVPRMQTRIRRQGLFMKRSCSLLIQENFRELKVKKIR